MRTEDLRVRISDVGFDKRRKLPEITGHRVQGSGLRVVVSGPRMQGLPAGCAYRV